MELINTGQLEQDIQNRRQPSESRPESTVEPAVMDRLWLRMTQMYGHRWTSQQGEEPNDLWCRALGVIEPSQIAMGLNAVLDGGDEWPPGLPEFLNMCRGRDDSAWERQAHKPFAPERSLVDLTGKEAAKEAGKSAIAEMKKLFGG